MKKNTYIITDYYIFVFSLALLVIGLSSTLLLAQDNPIMGISIFGFSKFYYFTVGLSIFSIYAMKFSTNHKPETSIFVIFSVGFIFTVILKYF